MSDILLTKNYLRNIYPTCDVGDIVIEGCYMLFVINLNPPPLVLFDGPLPDPTTDPTVPFDSAYQVTLIGNNTNFEAFAYCLVNPPLR